MGVAGFEPPPESTGKTQSHGESGAESGALPARRPPTDPDLEALVHAWPGLPEAVQRRILAMAESGVGGGRSK